MHIIKNLLRRYFLDIMGEMKSISKGIHILNGHFISLENKDSEIFYDLLLNLNKEAEFINFKDACRLIYENVKADQKLIAFSFDDGFEECYYNIYPVLKQFKVNAAFFINPSFIDGDKRFQREFVSKRLLLSIHKRPMTWGMIKKLHREGFIIGSHTVDHKRLSDITSKTELEYQIVESKRIIEKKILNKCEYFAWPYGGLDDINNSSLQIATDNYKFVFSASNYKRYLSFNKTVINRRH